MKRQAAVRGAAARQPTWWLASLLLPLLLSLAPPAAALPDGSLHWFVAGRPSVQAAQAIEVLAAAAAQGLDPGDYGGAVFARRLAADTGVPWAEDEQSQFDAGLTAAVQRYLRDVRSGRVDPRQLHARFELPRQMPDDPQALLRDALDRDQVAEAMREAPPRVPMYAQLVQALARYRALAGHPAWDQPLPPLPGRKLVRGQPYAGLALLAQRLQAVGDLPADAAPPDRFDEPLVAALGSFQHRHGLAPDGVLGRATLQQLDVPPSVRVRQIELTLERLRWTPFTRSPRMIVVNIPEFVLRAYEAVDQGVAVRLSLKVVVGKALDARTPLMHAPIRAIEFSPAWNVPPSIARRELVPRLRRDPAAFVQQDLEFVTGAGQTVTAWAPEHLDAVLRGGWRLRQRPGPGNALGGIKFVFPNEDNIYLHDTPAPQLFARDRRDFSHGCIRVEAPALLAAFVLQDDPAWPAERIREAMERGVTTTLVLRQRVPVLIAYATAIVRSNRVFFYQDVYGHDRLLDQALRRRAAPGDPAQRAGTVRP